MKTRDLKYKILQGGLVFLIVLILVFLVAPPGVRAGSLDIQPEPATHRLIEEITHD